MNDDRSTLADRLAEAGLGGERFIRCKAGEKGTRDHDTRYTEPPSTNYGVYAEAADRLVLLDVDDYDEGADATGLAGLADLPPTLEVESPHGGTHRYYVVDVTDDGRLPAAVLTDEFGKPNPNPSWGEVRVANQYVVGPGSQLDGCEKDGCDACAESDAGYYAIQADREIATVAADDLVSALRIDPGLAADEDDESDDSDPAPAGEVPDDRADRLQTALDSDEKLARLWRGDYSTYGDDRSRAECALAQKLGFWFGNDKATVRDLMNQAEPEKWAERTDDSYRESVLEAVDRNDDCYTPGSGQPAASSNSTAGEAVADGGATAAAGLDAGGTIGGPGPTQEDVKAQLRVDDDETLGDYSDREKAWAVWEVVHRSDEYHFRVQRQGEHSSLWWYDEGVWKRGGEERLRTLAKRLLGNGRYYGQKVHTELKEQAYGTAAIANHPDEFGLDSGKIAVENGVVDLREAYDGDGEDAFRPLEPDDLALTRLDVPYDPDADSEHFAPFVEEVVEDGMADAVQEYVGYCLHRNEMPYAKALMLVGSGANGKSTFLEVIRELLGDDTTSTPLHRFENSHHAAELYGKIANIQGDLSSASLSGRAIGMFKQLTGGDQISADEKYEDPFTFEPAAKHVYAANTTPDVSDYVDDSDTAWWRRWILVRFPNYYPEGSDQRDPDLAAKITGGRGYDGEMAAVLNWAIEGWGRLREEGEFSDSDGPAATRREWQRWGQSLDEFLVDCVVSDEDGPNVTTGEAWDVYLAWCDEADKDPIDSQQKFTRRLKTSGLDLGFGESVWTERHSAGYGYKRFAIADDAPVSVADGLRFPDSGEDDDEPDGDQRSLDDTTGGAADGGDRDQEDGDDSAGGVEAYADAGAPDDAAEDDPEALRRELVAYLGERDGEAGLDDALAALQLRADVDEAAAEAAVESAARDGRLIREGDVVRIG